MLFTITGKHIEITDAIREHAQEKVEKLPRYFNSISQIEVLVEGNEGGNHFVEVLVHAEHNDLLIAKETGSDVYACIDTAVHKLERQLKKVKEKQRSHKRLPVDLERAQPEPEEFEEDMTRIRPEEFLAAIMRRATAMCSGDQPEVYEAACFEDSYER